MLIYMWVIARMPGVDRPKFVIKYGGRVTQSPDKQNGRIGELRGRSTY
jgi:hypothetical protein